MGTDLLIELYKIPLIDSRGLIYIYIGFVIVVGGVDGGDNFINAASVGAAAALQPRPWVVCSFPLPSACGWILEKFSTRGWFIFGTWICFSIFWYCSMPPPIYGGLCFSKGCLFCEKR